MRSTTLSSKDIGFRKSEFGAKTQFLKTRYLKYYFGFFPLQNELICKFVLKRLISCWILICKLFGCENLQPSFWFWLVWTGSQWTTTFCLLYRCPPASAAGEVNRSGVRGGERFSSSFTADLTECRFNYKHE